MGTAAAVVAADDNDDVDNNYNNYINNEKYVECNILYKFCLHFFLMIWRCH